MRRFCSLICFALLAIGSFSPACNAEAPAKPGEREAEAAQERLEESQNPLVPRIAVTWVAEKGLRLLVILIVTFLLHVVVRTVAQRIVTFVTRSGADGSQTERENRANTLVSVFHNTAVLVIYAAALLMTLDVAGIPIAPLLGGAAVVGLAVAFAAQNLMKDYFYGFMILLEEQYSVNDVIKIGGITGVVERITLRITVLRDMDAVHFVPHGQITTVSNLTHKWSRAAFDIVVSYKEDPDRVMAALVELGKQIRREPGFSDAILSDPEMLGVDALTDSSFVIKFFIKTRPLKQWEVKRELLRRIKKKFDELGIEMPLPQRVVQYRPEQGGLEK